MLHRLIVVPIIFVISACRVVTLKKMAQSQSADLHGGGTATDEDTSIYSTSDSGGPDSDASDSDGDADTFTLPVRKKKDSNNHESNVDSAAGPETSCTISESDPFGNLNIRGSGKSNRASKRSSKMLGIDSKNKRNCCYFCGKCVTKIGRHLLQTHGREEEIIKIRSEHDRMKMDLMLKELRLKGNYRYNVECIQKGEGNLIVMRSPRFESDVSKFLPCPYCYGFLCKRELSKHCKVCPFRPTDFVVSKPIAHAKLLVLPHVKKTSTIEFDKEVLMKMNDDDVKMTVSQDPLIVEFGNSQISRLRANHERKVSLLSYRLRILGKLLIECEKVKGHKISLSNLLQPINFDLLMQCVQNLTIGKSKSLSLKIGLALRKCCEIARCMAIKLGNEEQKCHAEKLLVLLEGEFCNRKTSSNFHEGYSGELNQDPVPADDLLKFTGFLNDPVQCAVDEMVAPHFLVKTEEATG